MISVALFWRSYVDASNVKKILPSEYLWKSRILVSAPDEVIHDLIMNARDSE